MSRKTIVVVALIYIALCVPLSVFSQSLKDLSLKKSDELNLAGIVNAIYTSDGKYLIAAYSKDIAIYDLETKKRSFVFEKVAHDRVIAFILSHDGKQILVDCRNNDKNLHDFIFDTGTGKLIEKIEGTSMYFATSEGFMSIRTKVDYDSGDISVNVRDAVTSEVIKTHTIPGLIKNFQKSLTHWINANGTKYAISFLRNKDDAATWEIFIIDMKNPDPKSVIVVKGKSEYREYLYSVAISPDGNYMTIGTSLETQSREKTEALAWSREVMSIVRSAQYSGTDQALNRLYPLGFDKIYVKRDGPAVELSGYDFEREGSISIIDLRTGNVLASDKGYTVNTNGKRDHAHVRVGDLHFTSDSKAVFGLSTYGVTAFLEPNGWKIYKYNPAVNKNTKLSYYATFDDKSEFICFDHEEKNVMFRVIGSWNVLTAFRQ